jgi:hypothetical protein
MYCILPHVTTPSILNYIYDVDSRVKPVFNGIPQEHNLFPLWAYFRLIRVFSNWCNLTYLLRQWCGISVKNPMSDENVAINIM